ncbi:MAG: hypothetical protein K0S86_4996 [Geminicoccaceae bacterium]|nr:hypothetical protein [Geminicoccaceae bacterium]
MGTIALQIAIILLLLVANGVFAMSEIAVVTARRFRLEQRAEAGDAASRAALELAHEPTQFLSTVQIGITLVGIFAGAFGGATIAEALDARLERIAWLASYSEPVAFAVVVGGITYLSLIVGELVPKSIALADPEGIARRVARPMRLVARIGAPVVRLLTGSTNLLLKLLRIGPGDERGVSEEEIRAMIAQGAERGVIREAEQDILNQVFRLADRQVRAVMVPRPDIDWVDLEDDPDDVRKAMIASPYSRYLVCRGGVDHVVGFVRATELLRAYLSGSHASGALPDLAKLTRQPLYVPVTTPVLRMVELFRGSEVKVAIALDEFGGVAGLVTMGAILDDLVADLPGAPGGPDIVSRGDGTWLVDAAAPLDDVEDALGVRGLAANHSGYHTLGGFVMARLGHVPAVAEAFEWGGFRFEVVDMDGRRIDRVLVARAAPAANAVGAEDE